MRRQFRRLLRQSDIAGYRVFTGKQQHPLDIYLHVGDMVYSKGTDHGFERAFFKPYRLTLRNTVCWPAMGNREGATFNGNTIIGPCCDCYVLPTRGEASAVASGSEFHYSFDYGNVHFIAITSDDLDRFPTAPVARRLKADFGQTGADWIFAHWHGRGVESFLCPS